MTLDRNHLPNFSLLALNFNNIYTGFSRLACHTMFFKSDVAKAEILYNTAIIKVSHRLAAINISYNKDD